MKPTILQQFHYVVPFSSMASGLLRNNKVYATHLPLLKLDLDFNIGHLKLEGNWDFMVQSNPHHEPEWLSEYRERVQVDATLFMYDSINLDNESNDGLVIPIEGVIKDGFSTGSCSGMLILDNRRNNQGLLSDQWEMSLYLYDAQFNNAEMKFRLPLLKETAPEYEHVN